MSVLVLSIAALVYVVRYVLLVINRNTLLNSLVAIAADWLGVLASVAAIAAVITSGVMVIRWLIARRAAVFSHHGLPEQRSVRALWAGCVVPLANLLWAPVFVIELADHRRALRPAAKADRRVVDRLGFQLCGFDFRHGHQLRHGRPGHRQQHRVDGVLPICSRQPPWPPLPESSRGSSGNRSNGPRTAGSWWIRIAQIDPPSPHPLAPVELKGQEPAA